jgi:catechol 2,3-dioxygenase-like lactoylglutathione lyase family enzyme
MSIAIDHVGIPAADPAASARFLCEILGAGDTSTAGPDGEMVNLSAGPGALTYFDLFELFVPSISAIDSISAIEQRRRS